MTVSKELIQDLTSSSDMLLNWEVEFNYIFIYVIKYFNDPTSYILQIDDMTQTKIYQLKVRQNLSIELS